MNTACAAVRRLPVGAEVCPDGVHFRVWAPRRKHVAVVLAGGIVELGREPDGYFSGLAAGTSAGVRYQYRLDGEEPLYPDPASRFQPEGPHGPSQAIDPAGFPWTDAAWPGLALNGQVLYEMHIGTFTREGTYAAAMEQFSELKDTGITALELMPVAEFPGAFGWGYDGVDLFAPTRLYGEPDDLRRFVDRAHSVGLGVILDVVYNHVGPDGNYLKAFSPDYFTNKYENEWGEAINFDGQESGPVREFFIANAGYWIDEFHFDGLRLDATQSILDDSPVHVLVDIGRRARQAAGKRSIILVNENEPQHTNLVRPVEQGGCGLDMLWNDDFHHSAVVALTGRNEAYYSDHKGTPQEFVSAVKYGYLFQGQLYSWQGKRRGQPSFGLTPAAFVNYIQNHDQIANSALGLRINSLTSPGRYRAMTALLLLAPGTPMLFQGQEFAASTPFFYFADHKPDLAKVVDDGRADFLSQFPSIKAPDILTRLTSARERATFERSVLDFEDRIRNSQAYAMHRELLRIRREDATIRAQGAAGIDGAVLGPEAFLVRWFGENSEDRLLVVNFGIDLHLNPAPEPLLAPPRGMRWRKLFSTEDARYGGAGTPPQETDGNWLLPGHAAVLLRPAPADVADLERELRLERETIARRKREKYGDS
ncbi:MAG TPA: malto-oligosyltrehalose trehalohydrolase [Bryobacteraceae bacterium]|nr:malto-oligosyltrehalose trehalohydrolase [Bryobacteraceae bacterium]